VTIDANFTPYQTVHAPRGTVRMVKQIRWCMEGEDGGRRVSVIISDFKLRLPIGSGNNMTLEGILLEECVSFD
jgi:hypothetical protein